MIVTKGKIRSDSEAIQGDYTVVCEACRCWREPDFLLSTVVLGIIRPDSYINGQIVGVTIELLELIIGGALELLTSVFCYLVPVEYLKRFYGLFYSFFDLFYRL